MTNITPGPWRITHADSVCYRVGSDEYGGIALLHDPLAEELGTTDTLEANARAISLVPEMIEAIRLISGSHETGNNGAYNGEAVLCESYASRLRYILKQL